MHYTVSMSNTLAATVAKTRTGPEPKCADCGHGTLAHNAIGGACTKCECGHFRPAAAKVPPLGAGSLISVPAPYRIPGCTDRATVVVEWVSPDDSWFTDTTGNSYRTEDAVVIPLGVPVPAKAA